MQRFSSSISIIFGNVLVFVIYLQQNKTKLMTSSYNRLYEHFYGYLLLYNQFDNSLRLFNVLLNFSLTTNETMGDYYL